MKLDNSNYVYALKDPRLNPAKIFYIGKGTGSRKNDHIVYVENTAKGKYIKEIIDDGYDVIVTILSEDINEIQAIKLEAELIIAFGTEKSGGILKNIVSPSGSLNRELTKLNLPYGVYDKSQIGLKFLKEATLEFLKANPRGVKNSGLAKYLGLQSDNNGRQKDYLTYSILGVLMKENLVVKTENGYCVK